MASMKRSRVPVRSAGLLASISPMSTGLLLAYSTAPGHGRPADRRRPRVDCPGQPMLRPSPSAVWWDLVSHVRPNRPRIGNGNVDEKNLAPRYVRVVRSCRVADGRVYGDSRPSPLLGQGSTRDRDCQPEGVAC